MGKNVAVAFPDTYQEHLLPSPQQFTARPNNVSPREGSMGSAHVGPTWLRRTLTDSFRENAKDAVPSARIAMAGSRGHRGGHPGPWGVTP